MVRFSIVIVTYNSQEYIRQCLDSIFKQDLRDYEIVVIDNASCDKTRAIIGGYNAGVRIRANEKNLGFPEGVNTGISMSEGEYILTLNPDVVLENDFLSKVNDHIDGLGSDVGMLGVKILKAGPDRSIDSTGLVLARFVRFLDRGSGEKDAGQYDNNTDILGPCAAAAIYKRDMLNDVKMDGEYFDRDFFYLVEDFDIALRARRKGWKARYLPDAVCYHERNGSGMGRADKQFYSFRNRYFLIMKNMDMGLLLLLSLMLYDIPRFIFMLFTNGRTLGAIADVGTSAPAMLKKREHIMNAADKNIHPEAKA